MYVIDMMFTSFYNFFSVLFLKFINSYVALPFICISIKHPIAKICHNLFIPSPVYRYLGGFGFLCAPIITHTHSSPFGAIISLDCILVKRIALLYRMKPLNLLLTNKLLFDYTDLQSMHWKTPVTVSMLLTEGGTHLRGTGNVPEVLGCHKDWKVLLALGRWGSGV